MKPATAGISEQTAHAYKWHWYDTQLNISEIKQYENWGHLLKRDVGH